jgi:carotenoid 1,2-hydratase
VARNGYAWWYLDALSEDGEFGLVLIVFVGSVFSPYYARARRLAGAACADPQAHNAFNLSLYHRGRKVWTMTERGQRQLQRSAAQLRLHHSELAWQDDTLVARIDEIGVPWPRRVRGTIRLHLPGWQPRWHALDDAGCHRWWPIAPRADVDVAFDEPWLRWRGHGYLDSNRGDAPLEDGFVRWHWARAPLVGGRAAVMYDALRRDGSSAGLALRFDRHGETEVIERPPGSVLPAGAWGVTRATVSDAASPAQSRRVLEDGPFYVRSMVSASWLGEPVRAMHESLDLDRFRRPLVQAMLPFRMPRRA